MGWMKPEDGERLVWHGWAWTAAVVCGTLVLLGVIAPSTAAAQERAADGDGLVLDHPAYAPVVPPPGYRAALAAGTRAEDGRPGPGYWQQRVDYRIDARLEPESARLSGRGTITVRNETPAHRVALVLHLYPNIQAAGSPRNLPVSLTGGMEIHSLSVDGVPLSELEPRRFPGSRHGEQEEPGYRVGGTILTVNLPAVLTPGGVTQIETEWSYVVSGGGGLRNGHLNHEVFNIAQWYPQVAVFDDVFGQDVSEYLGRGEFYSDYGDFEVSVTVPEGWLVVATGTLQNSDEVLSPEASRRLAEAAQLDTVISVVSVRDREGGRATARSRDGWLTWRYSAENVRDFAFATSDRYVWDATGAETGAETGRALIQNVYDPALPYWADATLFGKHAIEFFSSYILPYPYPHATTAYGPPDVSGMEYPMLTFIERSGPGEPLNSTVSHELSHFWMPMIIGTKEMAYAWMDEGLTVFNNSLAMEDYYGASELDDRASMYAAVAMLGVEEPIMRHTDYTESFFAQQVAAYTKPGLLMRTLRHMMGDERFDAAYRDYARAWAFKHPMPWDFFAMMERAAGADLDWFWQSWFYETATLDQAIEAVEAAPGGVRITVSNLSDGVMPVELLVRLRDGPDRTFVWPASVWAGTRTVVRDIEIDGEVESVTIDPEGYYLDLDLSNNVWEAVDG